MNETYYIYYIIPSNNFVSEKEAGNDSEGLPTKSGLRLLTEYFPWIIILLLIYLTYKSVKG